MANFDLHTLSLEHEHWVELLSNDAPVLIRALQPGDLPLEQQLLQRVGSGTARYRALAATGAGGTVIVALAHVAGHLRMVGACRYTPNPGARYCECAVLVEPAWQRLGLGTRLMLHLVQAARANGCKAMISVDPANHYAMHRLLKRAGFSSRYTQSDCSEIFHECCF